jgi:predicted AlkP superfamily pyrophosphatase or phosphodiesterase
LLFSVSILQSAQRPKLVIYISVDQMKAEYLEWYKAEFTGGLKRFVSEGTVFTNADLNYAPSETGPGHATLGTGAYPMHSGILANEWIDLKTGKDVYCVEDSTAEKAEAEGGGVSPKSLAVTAIGDWLRQASPDSKVIAGWDIWSPLITTRAPCRNGRSYSMLGIGSDNMCRRLGRNCSLSPSTHATVLMNWRGR